MEYTFGRSATNSVMSRVFSSSLNFPSTVLLVLSARSGRTESDRWKCRLFLFDLFVDIAALDRIYERIFFRRAGCMLLLKLLSKVL